MHFLPTCFSSKLLHFLGTLPSKHGSWRGMTSHMDLHKTTCTQWATTHNWFGLPHIKWAVVSKSVNVGVLRASPTTTMFVIIVLCEYGRVCIPGQINYINACCKIYPLHKTKLLHIKQFIMYYSVHSVCRYYL
jgi:hypothetical protein